MHFSLCGLLRPTAASWRYQDSQTIAKSPFCTFLSFLHLHFASFMPLSALLFHDPKHYFFTHLNKNLNVAPLLSLLLAFKPTPPSRALELPLQAFVFVSQLAQCWRTLSCQIFPHYTDEYELKISRQTKRKSSLFMGLDLASCEFVFLFFVTGAAVLISLFPHVSLCLLEIFLS